MSDALAAIVELDEKSAAPELNVPECGSLGEFLEEYASVKATGGYVDYHFQGRRPLREIVELLDTILDENRTDCVVAICGGAQFGKTVLVLNLIAYVMGWRFLNLSYFLPDIDLVQGVVDTKFRPDVVDRLPIFAQMTRIGKAVNESGRQVSRKGAFMVQNGGKSAQGYFRGLNKPPTTFSADVAVIDEGDDCNATNAGYIPGRMTASDLRLTIQIGTQRYHGAGQNRAFLDGSQHVWEVTCPQCKARINPEEKWPQIVRVALDGKPGRNDPQLTSEGNFKRPGSDEVVAEFDHDAHYYLACPKDGKPLNVDRGRYRARRPEMVKDRRWSFRISQLSCPAIELKQLVQDWCQNAVHDPEKMRAFFCDRLAIPKNTSQKLTPEIIERAQRLEDVEMTLSTPATAPRYGGLDMGDRCWFLARDVESPALKRVRWMELISSESVVKRVVDLFNRLTLSCLFVDLRPAVEEARQLCYQLNGYGDWVPPLMPNPERERIAFPGGLVWDGEHGIWRGLKCAAVEFALRDTQGIKHKLGVTPEGRLYPVIQVNRDQSIQRVVDELLTPEESVWQRVNGTLREAPALRLPSVKPGCDRIVQTLVDHLLTGSRKEPVRDGKEHQFVDKVENHLLLSDAYAALAEVVASGNDAYFNILADTKGVRYQGQPASAGSDASGSGARRLFTPRRLGARPARRNPATR